MQKKDRICVVSVVLFLLIFSFSLFAAVPNVLKESFDYPEGDLLGQGETGNGWMGPWEDLENGTVSVVSGNLGYTGIDQPGGYLEVSEAGTLYRYFEETWPDDGTTYWISLLYQRFDGHDVDDSYNGLSLFLDSAELLYIGKPWGSKNIGVDATGVSGGLPSGIDAYDLNWIVVKLVMNGTADDDKIYYWINPDPNVEPDTTTADTSGNWNGSGGFNRLRIGSGNNPTPAECLYDEISFSKTYAGLTGEAPSPDQLPEPLVFFDFEETEGWDCIDQGTAKVNGAIEGEFIERANEGIVKRAGETGKCIEFTDETGSGMWDYVRVPYIEGFNSPNYTISIWGMYLREEPTWGYLFWADGEAWPVELEDRHIDVWLNPNQGEFGGGLDCMLNYVEGADETYMRTQTNSDELGFGPMDGDWHQFTIVLEDNVVQRAYIDGELGGEMEAIDEVVENAGDDLWIGGRPNDIDGNSSVKFVGLMDNFRFWDVALTEEQVVYLYNMEGPNGGSVGVAEKIETPMEFALAANYPNPFNPTTTIAFSLDKTQDVTVDVYDLLGHKVKTLVSGVQTAGVHTLQWDATNESGQRVSSGVYLYRLTAGNRTETRKMMLLK